MQDSYLNDERVQELWAYCKEHFKTEDDLKELIKQAINELVLGGTT